MVMLSILIDNTQKDLSSLESSFSHGDSKGTINEITMNIKT